MLSHYEDNGLTIDLPTLRQSLDFFEIRPNSNVYAYFHQEDSAPDAAVASLSEQFSGSFYLLYHVEDGEVVSFDTRIVPIVEHEVVVVD